MNQTTDPGPMARLEAMKDDPDLPSLIFQRLTGDPPETLPQLAKAWNVPKGRFVQWFTTMHGELYDVALKVHAADLALTAMQAALDATPEDVTVKKLQADVALKLAAKFDRARYGDSLRVEQKPVPEMDAGLIGQARDLLDLFVAKQHPSQLERVIRQESLTPLLPAVVPEGGTDDA